MDTFPPKICLNQKKLKKQFSRTRFCIILYYNAHLIAKALMYLYNAYSGKNDTALCNGIWHNHSQSTVYWKLSLPAKEKFILLKLTLPG